MWSFVRDDIYDTINFSFTDHFCFSGSDLSNRVVDETSWYLSENLVITSPTVYTD